MSPLQRALDEYLAVRRSLGFALRIPASLLRSFVTFVDQAGRPFITTDLALQWATQSSSVQAFTWTSRLGIVRRFAAWHHAIDPRTEVPPAGLLAHRYRRKSPYLYSDADVARLVRAAGTLPSIRGLRGRTYATLFGLLAATGMRLSEGLHLDRDDVDLAQGMLVIRCTKFGKSRLVPIHASTQDALREYAEARDRIVPRPGTPAVFLSEQGTRITEWSARYTFAAVSRIVGVQGRRAAAVMAGGPGCMTCGIDSQHGP
jgi:integrase/recombinase XerD